jgi:F-type H+-transporting ATPase subunit gamma
MALQTKVIKQKIVSVGNVQKVTKTMELVSVAKMRKAVDAMKKGDHYGKAILEMLVRMATQRHLDHPALRSRVGVKRLVIIFSADRGLCGQYHSRLEKRVKKVIEDSKGDFIECVAVGSEAHKIAKRLSINVRYSVSLANTSREEARDTLSKLVDWLLHTYQNDKELGRVSCIVNHFENAMTYKAVRSQLLPLDNETISELFGSDILETIDEAKHYNYSIEPNEDDVLEDVIPELLTSVLEQFSLDAAAAEHSARMVAMRRASDNAERMKEDLVRMYNRARQEAVTKEIIEIINTAGAV